MNCIEDELCRMPSALPSVNGHKNYELCFYTGQNKWLPSSSPTASVVMYSLCTTYYFHRLSIETVVAHSNWNAVMNEGTMEKGFFHSCCYDDLPLLVLILNISAGK
jgi:hypothetical protein